MFNIVYIQTAIHKFKHNKKAYLLNSLLLIFSTIIKIVVIDVFVDKTTEIDLWKNTMAYILITSSLMMLVALYRIPDFSNVIINGNIISYYIRPTRLVNQFLYFEIGETLISFIIIIPQFILTCLFILYYHIDLRIMSGLFTCFLAIIMSILMTNLFYSTTFLTKKNTAPKALLQSVAGLLSGSLIPLILWPESLVRFIKYNPFALMIDAPIKVLLGIYSPVFIVGQQFSWIFILYSLCFFYFERVFHSYTHVGG